MKVRPPRYGPPSPSGPAIKSADKVELDALRWVPSAWVAMGLTYAVVTHVSAIILRDLGLTTGQAVLAASALGLPYVVKPIYAPMVELNGTKRYFVIVAQVGLSATFLTSGILMSAQNHPVTGLLFLLATLALIGSVQDIATEGLFLTELDRKHQTAFTGLQSIAWNGAALAGSGALIALSSAWAEPHDSGHQTGWGIALCLCALLYCAAAVWHWQAMPIGARTVDPANRTEQRMAVAFVSFFRRPRILQGMILCVSFPLSAGLVEKIEPFFLTDTPALGGLGLARETLGALYATAGFGGLVVGATLGSLALLRHDLSTWMFPMGLAAAVPAAAYLLLSSIPSPSPALTIGAFTFVRACLAFGMVGYVVYLQRALTPGAFPTSHYNLASGLKALTIVASGAASGFLQSLLGYRGLFALAFACGLLALLACRRKTVAEATAETEPPNPDLVTALAD